MILCPTIILLGNLSRTINIKGTRSPFAYLQFVSKINTKNPSESSPDERSKLYIATCTFITGYISEKASSSS